MRSDPPGGHAVQRHSTVDTTCGEAEPRHRLGGLVDIPDCDVVGRIGEHEWWHRHKQISRQREDDIRRRIPKPSYRTLSGRRSVGVEQLDRRLVTPLTEPAHGGERRDSNTLAVGAERRRPETRVVAIQRRDCPASGKVVERDHLAVVDDDGPRSIRRHLESMRRGPPLWITPVARGLRSMVVRTLPLVSGLSHRFTASTARSRARSNGHSTSAWAATRRASATFDSASARSLSPIASKPATMATTSRTESPASRPLSRRVVRRCRRTSWSACRRLPSRKSRSVGVRSAPVWARHTCAWVSRTPR